MIPAGKPRSEQLVRYTENGEERHLLTRNYGSQNVKGRPCDRFGRCTPGEKEEIVQPQRVVEWVADLSQNNIRPTLKDLGDAYDKLEAARGKLEKDRGHLLAFPPPSSCEVLRIALEHHGPTQRSVPRRAAHG